MYDFIYPLFYSTVVISADPDATSHLGLHHLYQVSS